MDYFLKEITSNPARLSDGREVRFESIDGDYGVLATEDQKLIGLLDELIAERRGGVGRITKEEYEERLKKKLGTPSPFRHRMSDPPPHQPVAALPDPRKFQVAGGVVAKGSEQPMAVKTLRQRSDAPTLKLPGFGIPPGAAEPAKPAPSVPEPPSGDATVNRPVPKKVAPSTQPPPPPKPLV